VSCRHHLYLDVSPQTGAIKLNFPDLEVWEMAISCALDVADDGGVTLEDVGSIMNLTRERIRQMEIKALSRLSSVRDMKELRDYVEPAAHPGLG
jgi:ParB-like chromosome segregation protein Spo0J